MQSVNSQLRLMRGVKRRYSITKLPLKAKTLAAGKSATTEQWPPRLLAIPTQEIEH
jgi:hypothetical protein